MSAEVLQRLFDLQRLTGARVTEEVPENLTAFRFPVFVTYEQQGDEDYSVAGDEQVEEATTYVMALYISPTTDGTAANRYKLAREYIRRVREIFAPRKGLELRDEDGVLDELVFPATYLGYRGPITVSYPQDSDNTYLTVYFRIRVEETYLLDYDFETSFSD